MGATTKPLYDTDFVGWTAHTAELLRERRFEDVDLENVIEEIESLGKRDPYAVGSQLSRMLMHLVKQRIQPERAGSSGRESIVSARRAILRRMEQSPSLLRYLESTLERTYLDAVRDALDETGLLPTRKNVGLPERCPYTVAELLNEDLDTLRGRLG